MCQIIPDRFGQRTLIGVKRGIGGFLCPADATQRVAVVAATGGAHEATEQKDAVSVTGVIIIIRPNPIASQTAQEFLHRVRTAVR